MLMWRNGIDRRRFGQLLAGWTLAGHYPSRAQNPAPPLPQTDPSKAFERHYRADAQVLLLSVPLFRRKDVGDGFAVWRDSVAEDGKAERFLEFMGRSTPERAAGLNRFGFIQELSIKGGRSNTESRYFGLMSASNEESAAEARKALHTDAKEVWFSAIEGRVSTTSIDTVSARFLAPARTSSAERQQLIKQARVALASPEARRSETSCGALPPRPFLHVLADLVRGSGAAESAYVYNGRLYRLRVDRSVDAKAAKTYRDLGLIGEGHRVIRVAGSLWREGEGSRSEFRLWIQEGAERPLPLRIEYQPKSYLRLTFEARA